MDLTAPSICEIDETSDYGGSRDNSTDTIETTFVGFTKGLEGMSSLI